MEQNKKEIEVYKRKSSYATLSQHDCLAKDNSFIELTTWRNGEGVDIYVSNYEDKFINLSFGEFELIKKLIKKLN